MMFHFFQSIQENVGAFKDSKIIDFFPISRTLYHLEKKSLKNFAYSFYIIRKKMKFLNLRKNNHIHIIAGLAVLRLGPKFLFFKTQQVRVEIVISKAHTFLRKRVMMLGSNSRALVR